MQNLAKYNPKALLRDVAAGNVSAFRTLFDMYRARLYAAALKITKSPYAAEEIVQEIFASLWERRACLADVDDASAYIFTVAYHQSFRYLKKVAADARLFQSLMIRLQEARNETEEQVEVNETRQLIDHAVRELPPQRQRIYKLSRENGLTHQQIASELRISPLTVKKQLVLALRNIRAVLLKVTPLLALCMPRMFF
ncbi:RNA polymerase sigma-70 factor [Compostibacter hankyongensis]|uniref:RNA polymerase sigma-70 factor n=1 Tax=Compostibacter hankyongensis TaxID=1007089 RepID=A0ABP8FJG0_9BACT